MQGRSAYGSRGECLPGLVTTMYRYFVFAIFGGAASAQTGFSLDSMNTKVNPCENFFEYACGGWNAANPIPADQSRWARFNALMERNQRILKDIVETSGAKKNASAIERQISAYYTACMDEKGVEAKGISPLKAQMDKIAALSDRADLPLVIGALHNLGTGALFSFYSRPDNKNAKKIIAQADQGGLTLPDRDYYLKTDPPSVELRGKYVVHVQRMFELYGYEPGRAEAAAKTVLALETALAKVSMDRVSRRNPANTYHPGTKKDLIAAVPSFDWAAYWKTIETPGFDETNLVNPEFLKGLEVLVKATPLPDIQTYLSWKYLTSSAPSLPSRFEKENFAFFGTAMTGAKEQKQLWKRCIEAVDADLGEALGEKYVEVAFAGESKTRMLELVRNVETAMRKDIAEIDWMTPATKKRAQEKLNAIADKIGYPEKWRQYTYDVKPDDRLGNSERGNRFAFQRVVNKIGKEPDPKEWSMTPPTVNAYYSPQQNNINFPAGILQPPFFDAKMDDAVNYGAIGVVIGHELTHGFDDQGRRFDGAGNMADWWSVEDGREFEKRASCIEKQYGDFVAVADLKLNGKLTLGENVADNGGARIAYMALLEALKTKDPGKIDGFTPQQRFFLGFAQVWCGSMRDEAARMRVQTDPHSPGQYRVQGTLSNMPEFASAFSCKAGQPMVRGDAACRVW